MTKAPTKVQKMYRLVRRNDDGSAEYRCIDRTGSDTLYVHADGSSFSNFIGGVYGLCVPACGAVW